MLRAAPLLLLLALPGFPDAGSPDAGAGDADGGRPAAGPVARWTMLPAELMADAGATDLVEVSVGASVEVPLQKKTVLTVCDAVLAEVEDRPSGLRFTGVDAGTTRCGLWFFRNPFPQRTVRLTVVPVPVP